MPCTVSRPEVHKIADYLLAHKGEWVLRKDINKMLGVTSSQMESLMVALEETYPYICEEDRYDGVTKVRLMWRDWDAVS